MKARLASSHLILTLIAALRSTMQVRGAHSRTRGGARAQSGAKAASVNFASQQFPRLCADGRYLWSHAYIKKATAVQQVRDELF